MKQKTHPNLLLKVFLSHAHADATRLRLHNRLVADGVASSLDKEKIIHYQSFAV